MEGDAILRDVYIKHYPLYNTTKMLTNYLLGMTYLKSSTTINTSETVWRACGNKQLYDMSISYLQLISISPTK